MADIRNVTKDFAVAPQIRLADVALAASLGFKMLINNRPDGEAPDQPSGAEIEGAAKAAGLDYVYIPVRGGPTQFEVDAVQAAVAEAKGPVLAYCRSGTRSIVTWSIGQARAQTRSTAELLALGRDAGYDLSAVLAR